MLFNCRKLNNCMELLLSSLWGKLKGIVWGWVIFSDRRKLFLEDHSFKQIKSV
uniref:Uncharacterized protein n=1 Tax=Rhizophora mucronata TaxID=61149 RepID=A0A2P2LP04_RHIMU